MENGIVNCGVLYLSHLMDGQGCLEELNTLIANEQDAGWAYEHYNQVCLNTTTDCEENPFAYGCGSLMNKERTGLRARPEQFTERILSRKQAPITNHIMDVVAIVAQGYNYGIGRVRLMSQKAKTCLSLHRDLDELRFHVPLRTNNRFFFVVADKVMRMPNVGGLYSLSTADLHTAVNADETAERLHLVFETYRIPYSASR